MRDVGAGAGRLWVEQRDGTTATSASAPPAPVDRKTLRAVSLPDVSKLDAPVQQQLRDGYAALTAKTGNPAISDVDLGFAYGEMGKLLMAAEYRDGGRARAFSTRRR